MADPYLAHPLGAYKNIRFDYGRGLSSYVNLHDFVQGDVDVERNTWTLIRDDRFVCVPMLTI